MNISSLPKIAIILINYNGWEDTIECIESLLKISYNNFEIVLVDNASTNNSVEFIKSWAAGDLLVKAQSEKLNHLSSPPFEKPLLFNQVLFDSLFSFQLPFNPSASFTLIESRFNNGFAAGNNLAIKFLEEFSYFNYAWILNNDTVVESNILNKFSDFIALNFHMNFGIIGNKLLYYHNPDIINGIGGVYNPTFGKGKIIGFNQPATVSFENKIDHLDYFIGASLFVNQKFIEDVGLMNEDYFLYYEELDWMVRGRKKGWPYGYLEDLVVFHKEGGSIGTSTDMKKTSKLAEYYLLRNRIVFTRKYYPQFLIPVYLGFIPLVIKRILQGRISRIPNILKSIFNVKFS